MKKNQQLKRIKRVLIVEDDKDWREQIAISLREFDRDLGQIAVGSAQQALDELLRNDPNHEIKLLILDWHLGDGSTATGHTVMTKGLANRPDIVVVVLTGALSDAGFKDLMDKRGWTIEGEVLKMKNGSAHLIFKSEICRRPDGRGKKGLPKLVIELKRSTIQAALKASCATKPELEVKDPEYRVVVWHKAGSPGVEYVFNSKRMAAVVKCLHQAYKNGEPCVHIEDINRFIDAYVTLEEDDIGAISKRPMKDLMHGSLAWKPGPDRLIEECPGKHRHYRLKLTQTPSQ